MALRTVTKVVSSEKKTDGNKATVNQYIGSKILPFCDPFLLLDEFKLCPGAGFPDHPHRGFETVTYINQGILAHEDFCGHKGQINPGGVQCMTAGRGIVHCELPHGDSEEPVKGIQLWVNLPRNLKMCEPAYQEVGNKDVPSFAKGGVAMRIIVGDVTGMISKVHTRVPVIYIDFEISPRVEHEQPIQDGWNAVVCVLSGALYISGEIVEEKNIAILSKRGAVRFRNNSEVTTRFILLAGEPNNEPIARSSGKHGFVMNTQEEIDKAEEDFKNGRDGFEKVLSWRKQ